MIKRQGEEKMCPKENEVWIPFYKETGCQER